MSCSEFDRLKKLTTSLLLWKGFLFLYLRNWHCMAFNLDDKYPDIVRNSRSNSYFGYSVAFWNGPNGYDVLVGAPKFTFGTLVTGGLFRCNIKTSSCNLVDIELKSISNSSRSGQWLGVALDVNPMNESLVTVCAHRAKFLNRKKTSNVTTGICYHLKNLRTHKVTKYPKGFSALGMSVHYSKRSNILIIGDPAQYTFRGGYYEETMYGSEVLFIQGDIDAYAGYSVTILNNKSAIGIPRYQQYGGVRYKDQIITFKSRYAFGSYFGSALLAVDFNNDGKEDLVVGAPFYSEKFIEEGRVYIFFFSNNQLNSVADTILSIPSYRSQFGKTFSTGDFNNDGFSDLVVAAPYENAGTGTIYIFSGRQSGLSKMFSQRIQGKNFQPNIQAFGISLSRTADIDSNGYLDIAVSAFLSDQVFILLGRPIVQVKGSLSANPRILRTCSDCWEKDHSVMTLIKVEMNLGKMDPLIFNIHLDMDSNRKPMKRRTFLQNNEREFKDTVKIKRFFRKEFPVYIKNTVDILEPINFTFIYQLKDKGYMTSCKNTCPIAKNGSFSTLIKFDIGCGFDDVCQTCLIISLKYEGSPIILGKDERFKLLVKVENLGENAYSAKANIFYSEFLEFESVNQTSDSNVECHQEMNETLSCFLGHPLKEKSQMLFEIVFFINRILKDDSIFVKMNATTISKVEDSCENNTQQIRLPIFFKSDLEVTGVSYPENDVFRGPPSKKMNVIHEYEIRNNGPSDALDVRFFVLVPKANFQNIPLFIPQKILAKKENDEILNACHLKPFTEKKEDFKATMKQLKQNGCVFNCSRFKCHNISCELNKVKTNDPVVKIQIHFEINTELLKLFQGQIRSLKIVTNSTLTQVPSYRLKVLKFDHAQANTIILISRLPAKLKWWVVICSIAVGLLILIIFSILLWHCGYFKRIRVSKEMKEEERLKEERSLLEYDQGRRPSMKIYTHDKVTEFEEIPQID